MKVHAEGAESRILKGAQKILRGNAAILCELRCRSSSTLAKLKSLAADAGRRIRYIDRDAEMGEQAEYGTVLLERHHNPGVDAKTRQFRTG